MIARTLGAAALILLAPTAMACGGIQGTHECGAAPAASAGCQHVIVTAAMRVHISRADASPPGPSAHLALPPGTVVVVCPAPPTLSKTESEIVQFLKETPREN